MKRTVVYVVALVAVAMLAIGAISVPGVAATKKQFSADPFVRTARSAERVERWGLNGTGNSLAHNIELYMWKDIYMMGKVVFVLDLEDGYVIRVLTRHTDHNWDGGVVTLVYWDAPLLFTVSEGTIVEVVATVVGWETLPTGGAFPMLSVVAFQEMYWAGVAEGEASED